MDENIKFLIGLDVHNDSIEVAAAEAGRAPARLVATIAGASPRPAMPTPDGC